MKTEKYTEGLDMNQFRHIPELSVYNYNYYRGFDNDTLLGDSDDDNTTTWYLSGEDRTYIGYSLNSENEILHTALNT